MGSIFSWQYRRFFGFHWGIPYMDSPSKAADPYINPKTSARITRNLVRRMEKGGSPEKIAKYPRDAIIEALSKARYLSHDFFIFHPGKERAASLHPSLQQIMDSASGDELSRIASGEMGHHVVLDDILQNPKTPREAVLHIALRSHTSSLIPDIAFKAYSSLRDNLTPAELRFVSNSHNHSVLQDILSDPNTPEDILARYANEPVVRVNDSYSLHVGEFVTGNPYIVSLTEKARKTTDLDGLVRLAQKPFPCVRLEVARNPSCPTQALDELARDPRWLVKLAAAKNPNTSPAPVARVLGEIRRDSYKVQTGTITVHECVAACHDGARWEYVDYPVMDTRYGYISKSLETAREVLDSHPRDTPTILFQLKILNHELLDALYPA
ncbi:hypothetical protein KY359_06595 [Candidatus Woesearchaeota archaeon]|nr:hypothetical protein [Candidatus Woesearchaeota archaeon]